MITVYSPISFGKKLGHTPHYDLRAGCQILTTRSTIDLGQLERLPNTDYYFRPEQKPRFVPMSLPDLLRASDAHRKDKGIVTKSNESRSQFTPL